MSKKLIYVIFFTLVLGLVQGQALGKEWDRAAYWDGRYPSAWGGGGEAIRDGLEAAGYTILDADELKTWMDARIADGALSVVVFCRDVVPDTVAESMSDTCTLRRYLDAGGKIVWISDWPFYYQGSSDGTMVTWGSAGAISVLGFNASSGPNDTNDEVVFTNAGVTWGLTETWQSQRPTSSTITENLTVLATISSGSAAAWVKHYVEGDNYRGFVRIFDRSGSPTNVDDIIRLAEYVVKKSSNPDPADGAILLEMWVILGWSPGAYAASNDVYISDNFDDVNNGTGDAFRGNQDMTSTTFFVGIFGCPYPDGLVPDTTYYWRIDDVEADGTTKYKGNVWSFTIPPRIAYEPIPVDGARFVDPNAELNWTAGLGANLHYVYFGDNFDDVNSAVGALFQADATYTPGTLELDKTYYWRVDESADAITMLKGDVWSFKTLPDVPITDPNLVGWWKLDEGTSGMVIDWSGHGNHGTINGDPQSVAGYDGDALEFDGVDDYVDCGNDPSLDITAPITIMIWARPSVVGETHTTNPGVIAKAESGVDWSWQLRYKAVGTPGYMGFQFNPLSGDRVWVHVGQNLEVGEWYHIAGVADGTNAICYLNGQETDRQPLVDFQSGNGKLFIGYEGWIPWYGAADDARIYNKALTQDEIKQVMRGDPLLAWSPKPSNGSTLYIREATPLSWSAGENASQHDVYFGTDRGAVADANASDTTGIYRGRQIGTSYTPPDVEWGGGPYYWRINEYNTDATISEGKIWSFTVIDFIGIEDFEDYNDFEPDRIFDTWMDGWGVDTNGSEVGYADPNFLAGEHHVETTIVHGGSQSMPYSYENNFKYSEATYSPTQRDWTEEGVGVLSLWFYGDAANAAERMYVALNGGTAVYHDNANASQIEEWTEWTIDLQAFTGVGLTNVNRIAIGFGDMNNLQAGGTGMVFFDDIRLYRPAP